MAEKNAALMIQGIETQFGAQQVHRGVSFSVARGTVAALIGGSGSGKSVLLREIIGLLKPSAGEVVLLGQNVWKIEPAQLKLLRSKIGVLFQNGALFSALSVQQNVALPLKEQLDLTESQIEEIVRLKLALSGLGAETAYKMPSELSGGMRKRVALARALALEPEVLFLDEPTSGLDPINARSFDQLVRTLANNLGITVVMVTHDLDTLQGIVDKIVALGEGKIIAEGGFDQVSKIDHPWLKEYFSSRAAERGGAH